MKKTILFSAVSLALSGHAMGAAYKLPEQSLNSMALSGAYVANAHGADASYNNPAAMAFNDDASRVEADLTFIYLSGIQSENNTWPSYTPFHKDEMKTEVFVLPDLHYSSPAVGDFRYGFSLVFPDGLTRRWKGVNQAFAEEFTLQTIEANPTIAYKVNDRFSVGGGLRAIYSKGIVRSSDSAFPPVPAFDVSGMPFGRLMKGDSWDYGYNLALHFKANEDLDLAVTYRSKIDLSPKGHARLTYRDYTGGVPGGEQMVVYNGDASVKLPIPATLTLAGAYTFDKTTVELLYERTYWSAYKELDFQYAYPLSLTPGVGGPLGAAYDDPLPKHWKDSNTFRIGLTHQVDDRVTLMLGYAYDETPVPEKYVGLELPDSDANIFSAGFRYKYSDKLNFGAAFLFDKKDELKLEPGENLEMGGFLSGGARFENGYAYLFTLGAEYKF